jgi:hypothetical protein
VYKKPTQPVILESEITQKQQAMKDAGYPVTVDGVWGKKSEEVYEEYLKKEHDTTIHHDTSTRTTPVSTEQKVTKETRSLPEGDPIYGPTNALIGIYNTHTGVFTPDYDNLAGRAKVNSADEKLLHDAEALQDYLHIHGVKYKKISEK